MGLKPNEFWSLTLAEYNKMVKGYSKRRRNNLYGFAMVTAALYEVNRDRKRRPKPFTPNDFMPKEELKLKPKQTVDEQIAIVRMLNLAFDGKDSTAKER